jgi:hypothetical protein
MRKVTPVAFLGVEYLPDPVVPEGELLKLTGTFFNESMNLKVEIELNDG